MAVYEYSAFTLKGRKKNGIIDAASMMDATEKLRKKGVFPITLEVAESRMKKRSGVSVFSDIQLFSRIPSSEVTLITRQLATLLSAGFPLDKAISTLIPQTDSKGLQRVLSELKSAIEEGSSFGDALAARPNVFSPVFINMVRSGESSGTLEVVLERIADFSEKKEDTKKKIQAALAYPVFMAVIGVFVLVFLLTYIVPGITGIFIDMNQALPMPTQILMDTSDLLVRYWWVALSLPFISVAGMVWIRNTRGGRLVLDRLVLYLPVLGPLIKKMVAARFLRTLSSLLENGVPMVTALDISKTISGNTVVADLVNQAARSVEQGGTIGSVVEQSRIFPGLAAQMIKVGEKSGEIEQMLEKSADLFDRDVNNTVAAATSVIEPMIILIMGVVIAFIILAVCLPIFEINQLIG